MKMLLTGGFLVAFSIICYSQNPPSIKENNHLSSNQNDQYAGSGKGNVMKNLAFGGAIILLAFTGLLVSNYRMKQQQNRQLNRILEEKIALQEQNNKMEGTFHHHAKNNLQLAISLLNIHLMQLENGPCTLAIRESKGRLTALEIIHEITSLSPSANSINMRAYASELTRQLLTNFATGNNVQCSMDVMAAIDLNINQAVTVGLIINEAVSNALEYAFPNDRKGTIIVSFIKGDGDELLLSVAHDGARSAADFNSSERASGGFHFMETLAEQLAGKLRFRRDSGFEILLAFRNWEAWPVCKQSLNQH